MQKRASGGAEAPQLGQRRSSRAPHAMQKAAPAGFSVPQLPQFMCRDYSPGGDPLCDERHAGPQAPGSAGCARIALSGQAAGVPVDIRQLREQRVVHEGEAPPVDLEHGPGMGWVPERPQLTVEVVAAPHHPQPLEFLA